MIADRSYEIRVRATTLDEIEDVRRIREEPAVLQGILAVPYTDPARFKDNFSRPSVGSFRLSAVAVYPAGQEVLVGNLVMFVGVRDTAHLADMGIHVSTAYQGQGVGAALMAAMCDLADNWLNLHRLELDVYTDNVAAIHLYEKFGFHTEATLQRYAFRNGAYVDAHLMGRMHPHHR
jgi:putative acetyltransferase